MPGRRRLSPICSILEATYRRYLSSLNVLPETETHIWGQNFLSGYLLTYMLYAKIAQIETGKGTMRVYQELFSLRFNLCVLISSAFIAHVPV